MRISDWSSDVCSSDLAVAAILAERPNAKLDPPVLRGQIVAYRPFFDIPSGKNIPFGVQTDADWSAAIKSMEQTGLIGPGHKPADYSPNADRKSVVEGTSGSVRVGQGGRRLLKKTKRIRQRSSNK